MVRPHTLLTLTEENCKGRSCFEQYKAPMPTHPTPSLYRLLSICNQCFPLIGKRIKLSDIHYWTWNLLGYRRRAVSIRLGKGDPHNGSDGKSLEHLETILRERFDDVVWVSVDFLIDPPSEETKLRHMLLDMKKTLRDVEFWRERWRFVAADSQGRLEKAVAVGMDGIAEECKKELDAQDVKYAARIESCLLRWEDLNMSLLLKSR